MEIEIVNGAPFVRDEDGTLRPVRVFSGASPDGYDSPGAQFHFVDAQGRGKILERRPRPDTTLPAP